MDADLIEKLILSFIIPIVLMVLYISHSISLLWGNDFEGTFIDVEQRIRIKSSKFFITILSKKKKQETFEIVKFDFRLITKGDHLKKTGTKLFINDEEYDLLSYTKRNAVIGFFTYVVIVVGLFVLATSF